MSFMFPKLPCCLWLMSPTSSMAIAASFLILLRRKGCNQRKTVFYTYLHSLQLAWFQLLHPSLCCPFNKYLLRTYSVCRALPFFCTGILGWGFYRCIKHFLSNIFLTINKQNNFEGSSHTEAWPTVLPQSVFLVNVTLLRFGNRVFFFFLIKPSDSFQFVCLLGPLRRQNQNQIT